MEAPEPRWRRLGPGERREQIIDAAVRVFTASAYSEVQVADIAAEAGVTRGLLHHYFGTKRDLYLTAVRAVCTVPGADEVRTARGPLAHRVAVSVEWLLRTQEYFGAGWVRLAGQAASGDPEVQQILDEADRQAAERLLTVVGFAGTEPERQVALASAVVFGGMARFAGRAWLEQETLDRDQVRALLVGTLTALLADVVPQMTAMAERET